MNQLRWRIFCFLLQEGNSFWRTDFSLLFFFGMSHGVSIHTDNRLSVVYVVNIASLASVSLPLNKLIVYLTVTSIFLINYWLACFS